MKLKRKKIIFWGGFRLGQEVDPRKVRVGLFRYKKKRFGLVEQLNVLHSKEDTKKKKKKKEALFFNPTFGCN